MKLKIHPLFIVLTFYFIIIGQIGLLCGYFIAIITHEVAHARMAKLRGYTLGVITIMPYGGVIDGGIGYNKTDNILIALAGPLFNFVIAAFLTAFWWLMPSLYNFTKDICVANVAMACVNILPIYPLDGSRIAYSLSKNKMRAIKFMKIASVGVGLALLGLCVLSVWYAFNLSLGIFGIFLVYGSFIKGDEYAYLHVTENTPLVKKYQYGIRKSVVLVGQECQLYRMLAMINNNEKIDFCVVNEAGDEIMTFDEQTLGKLCVDNELITAIGKLLEQISATRAQ